jgi:hypothetical protein
MPRTTIRSAPDSAGFEPKATPGLMLFEIALCAILAALLIRQGLIPAWRFLNTDFPNYYLVARLLREGYSLDRIYDWIWLQRIKDHWGLDQSLVGFAGLTPFSALPIFALSFYSALTAKRIWLVINLLLLTGGAELLHRSTSLGRRRIWLLILLAVLPLRTNFLYGQMHLSVFFLMVLAWYLHRRNRELACGAAVALAAALKVYPLLFVLYFFWKRQWRAAIATLAAALVIVIIGSLWMGGDVMRVYALQVLPRSLIGETLDPYNVHSASAVTLFHRLFLFELELNPSPFFDSPSLYSVLYPLWQLTIFFPLFALLRPSPVRSDSEQMGWGAFLLALLVISPFPASYHFAVMILSIILLVDVLLRQKKLNLALTATVLYFLVIVADYFAVAGSRLTPRFGTLFAFSRLWFAIAFLVFYLVCLHKDSPFKIDRRLAVLSVLAIIALALSIVTYRHHFFLRSEEMTRRFPGPTNTYLTTLPKPFSGGYLSVVMLPEGYRVLDQRGGRIGSRPVIAKLTDRSSDQLSYAITPDHSVLLEIADSGGSRILHTDDNSIVAQDAESPAVSPDGTTLAFLREPKGRGRLWIAHMSTSGGGSGAHASSDPPVRVTGDDYDVRSVSFMRSGALLFLAKRKGEFSLYSVQPGSPPALFFGPREMASFAVSPDEDRIAFTELIRNRWQLAALDTHSGRVTVLTRTDCNAYTPAWLNSTTIVYATDCGRGMGLSALASTAYTGQ